MATDLDHPLAPPRSGPIYLGEILSPTPYRDAEDTGTLLADGTHAPAHTSAYLAVQASILTWLRIHSAEDLTPRQAQQWTEECGSGTHRTHADQAIRLCYYMRQLHFEVYVKLLPGQHEIKCFMIPLRGPGSAGTAPDVCYWHQNWQTGVVHEVPFERTARARASGRTSQSRARRNAVRDMVETSLLQERSLAIAAEYAARFATRRPATSRRRLSDLASLDNDED